MVTWYGRAYKLTNHSQNKADLTADHLSGKIGYNKQTKIHVFLKSYLRLLNMVYNKFGGSFCSVLITVAEADWKFKPVLAGKGSSGPDRFDILSDQAFHFHVCCMIAYSRKVSAYLKRFCEIYLIFVFCITLTNIHHGNDGGTEVM